MIYHPYKAQLSNSKRHVLCWSINVLAHYTVTGGVYITNGHGSSYEFCWPSCWECSLGIEATCTYSFKQSQLGCVWGENVIFMLGPHVWNHCDMRGAFWNISGSIVCPSYIRHCGEPWIHQACSELFCFPSIWLLGSADLPRHSPSIAVCMIDIGTVKPLSLLGLVEREMRFLCEGVPRSCGSSHDGNTFYNFSFPCVPFM